jgi:hypothetical protein
VLRPLAGDRDLIYSLVRHGSGGFDA